MPVLKEYPLFDFEPSEEEGIVEMLFLGSGGNKSSGEGANFRDITHLLEWANDILHANQLTAQQQKARSKQIRFSAELLRQAVQETKGISLPPIKKPKKKMQQKTNKQEPSAAGDTAQC